MLYIISDIQFIIAYSKLRYTIVAVSDIRSLKALLPSIKMLGNQATTEQRWDMYEGVLEAYKTKLRKFKTKGQS